MAIDDSPTKRFGSCVEAANIHHNPTPGPGDGDWLYGHNRVCLAMIMGHPFFGVIALPLPLLSLLYVRKVDIDKLKLRHDREFRTKHELALELCTQVIWTLRALGSQAGFIVVFDGAYAASRHHDRPYVDQRSNQRFKRSDAKLFDLPVNKVGQPGRPRKYGKNRISLKKRAADRRGWQSIRYCCRGTLVERR